jgi:hypothetical protein
MGGEEHPGVDLPSLENPPGPVCWRCDDEMVIRVYAGHSFPCPACTSRPSRRHLLISVLWKARPRGHYTTKR